MSFWLPGYCKITPRLLKLQSSSLNFPGITFGHLCHTFGMMKRKLEYKIWYSKIYQKMQREIWWWAWIHPKAFAKSVPCCVSKTRNDKMNLVLERRVFSFFSRGLVGRTAKGQTKGDVQARTDLELQRHSLASTQIIELWEEITWYGP